MNTSQWACFLMAVALAFGSTAFAQQNKFKPADNAALRYWAAFSEMQDWATTPENAKELSAILAGTTPYDDLKYKELVARNEPALRVMQRGTTLSSCDWGLDYELGPDTPVEYVRRALQLGRLNVLFAFHQMINGDKAGAVRTLAAGIHFARDVANGGSLFATLAARDLLESHFKAAEFAMHNGISSEQQAALKRAVAQIGPEGLDWDSAIRMEMASLNRPPWQKDIPLGRVTQAYVNALKNPSTLPHLQQLLAEIPMPSREVIPSPQRIIQEKQEFDAKLQKVRIALQ
jgi:hypothetical protein